MTLLVEFSLAERLCSVIWTTCSCGFSHLKVCFQHTGKHIDKNYIDIEDFFGLIETLIQLI